MAHFF